MKYFLAQVDKRVPEPDIKDWYNTLNPKLVEQTRYKEIPEYVKFRVEPNERAFYSDIISFPFFMVKKNVARVINAYVPDMEFREMFLFDSGNNRVEQYMLPALEVMDCLTEETVYEKDAKTVKQPVISIEKSLNRVLFRVPGLSNTQAVMHLDLAESLLHREVRGLALTEIKIV